MLLQMLLLCSVALAVTEPPLTHPPDTAALFPALAPISAHRPGCPRREDIHPCECLEIPKMDANGSSEVETVAFCKTIRNAEVLQMALKGMRGHVIDFMVLDSCKLPPFPNGLFFNIGIRWMEILNSTIQFQQNYFECATNCW